MTVNFSMVWWYHTMIDIREYDDRLTDSQVQQMSGI